MEFQPTIFATKKIKTIRSKVDLRSRGRDYRLDPTAQPNGAEEYETNHETRGLFASQGGGHLERWGEGLGICSFQKRQGLFRFYRA